MDLLEQYQRYFLMSSS